MTHWSLFAEDFLRTAVVIGVAIAIGIVLNRWFMGGD